MVQITLDNFKNTESLVIYELPEGTSNIRALKAEIEATENIATNVQRLVYNERELHDEEMVNAFNCGTIHLTKSRVHFHVWYGPNISHNLDTAEREVREVLIDLSEPIHTSVWTWVFLKPQDDHFRRWGFFAEIFTLNSQGQHRNLSEINQSFSSYGIGNGDDIHFRLASLDKPETLLLTPFTNSEKQYRSAPAGSYVRRYGGPSLVDTYDPFAGKKVDRTARVKYSWDGNMNATYAGIKGLPLEPGALVHIISEEGDKWLYGVGTESVKISRGVELRSNRYGYIPENYVSPSENDPAIKDVPETPPLPPFPFPQARGMSFDVPIGDKGHSFLVISTDYECFSCPTDPTHVTMKLLSVTHGARRISGISLCITVAPNNLITDIQTQGGPIPSEPIHMDGEVTTNQSEGMQKEVSAGLRKESTIFWNLKAPATNLDEKGLEGEEYISFVLARKPDRFTYNCRVTHAKDGIEKEVGRRSKA